MVKVILRLEALLIFLLSLFFFSALNNVSWLAIIAFWILPDISIAGYLLNKTLGRIIYNLVHNYLPASFVVFVGMLSQSDVIMAFGIAYVSHIALDRALGFGLKYQSGFKDTHLQKV